MSYVRPVILYDCEAWCLKESEMIILQRTERSSMREMRQYSSNYEELSMESMLLLGLNEAIDQLSMTIILCSWVGELTHNGFSGSSFPPFLGF